VSNDVQVTTISKVNNQDIRQNREWVRVIQEITLSDCVTNRVLHQQESPIVLLVNAPESCEVAAKMQLVLSKDLAAWLVKNDIGVEPATELSNDKLIEFAKLVFEANTLQLVSLSESYEKILQTVKESQRRRPEFN